MTTGSQGDVSRRLFQVLPPSWFPNPAPNIHALLQGLATVGSSAYSMIAFAKAQTRLLTSNGIFIDLFGFSYLGRTITRNSGEADATYALRIQTEILRERATRAGMIKALSDLTGSAPTIFEPWNTNDAGALNMGTLALAGPPGPFVQANTSGITPSASSTLSGNTPAGAFNGGTGWGSNADVPQWLEADFGSGVVINAYTLFRASTQPGGWTSNEWSPAAWMFQGSNDNSTWTTLDARAGQLIAIDAAATLYRFSNTVAYRFYRINVTASNGTGGEFVNITALGLGTAVAGSNGAGAIGSIILPSQVLITVPAVSLQSIPNVAGLGSYLAGLGTGSFELVDEADTVGPVTPTSIYNTINNTKPTGVSAWVNIL